MDEYQAQRTTIDLTVRNCKVELRWYRNTRRPQSLTLTNLRLFASNPTKNTKDNMSISFVTSGDTIRLSQIILNSFQKLVGRELSSRAGSPSAQAANLFDLPDVVVAHGTESDPILCYGNQAALDLWETDIESLLKMPSRKTAEPKERSDRAEMLKRGSELGYIADYCGVRISTTGRRFRITNALIWNLTNEFGQRLGQAATFSEWSYV